MAWEIRFTPRAAQAYRKLDKPVQKRISAFLHNVSKLDDPRMRGKALVANKVGLWRWRVGDHRIIADIDSETVVVTVVDVGHRSVVYR